MKIIWPLKRCFNGAGAGWPRKTSIGMTIGSTTGYKVMIFCPYVQRINPKYEDVSGRAHLSFDLRVVPGPTGNDEVKIITT